VFLVLERSSYSRYISGAGDPRTKVHLVLGKSDPNNSSAHHQQSIVIVPADTPGVKIIRQMMVMGFDDAPEGHSEIIYDNVRVPLGNLVLGWGRGFEVGIALEYNSRPLLTPKNRSSKGASDLGGYTTA
jgi:alkylation response protein AidB-like acyl-CoA dehydrogenase